MRLLLGTVAIALAAVGGDMATGAEDRLKGGLLILLASALMLVATAEPA